jgi:hypothetical protein
VENLTAFAIRDTARNRDLLVRVDIPQGAPQPLPVVLFAPSNPVNQPNPANPDGHLGDRTWGNTLASAGFVVIHLNSPETAAAAYCVELQVPPAECEGGDFTRHPSAGGTLHSIWIAQPRDASTVLDQLAYVGSQIGVQLDASRVAAAGRLGGAHTVMLLGGARVDISPSVRGFSAPDQRFAAHLVILPQVSGQLGFSATSWTGITKPVLMQTYYNSETYAFMPPGDKYQAFFTSSQATIPAFTLEDSGNPLTVFIGRNGVAFFDAYLRGLPAARTWLTTNQLAIWSAGIGQMSAK